MYNLRSLEGGAKKKKKKNDGIENECKKSFCVRTNAGRNELCSLFMDMTPAARKAIINVGRKLFDASLDVRMFNREFKKMLYKAYEADEKPKKKKSTKAAMKFNEFINITTKKRKTIADRSTIFAEKKTNPITKKKRYHFYVKKTDTTPRMRKSVTKEMAIDLNKWKKHKVTLDKLNKKYSALRQKAKAKKKSKK